MLGGSLSATAKDAMSGAHLAMGAGNVLQQAPRLGDPTRMMEVDTDEVDATVTKDVVKLALGVSTEKEAHIVGTTKRENGHTIEFANREARDSALKAMEEYGQLPCTRGAESAPLRNLTRVHAIDCVEWVQEGMCSVEAGACPFRHPPPVARVPCRHWIRNHGECWYAEHCNFLHPGSAAQRTGASADSKAHSGGDTGTAAAGPAALASLTSPPRLPESLPRAVRPSGGNPWATSSTASAIPAAASPMPSSPREIPGASAQKHKAIGSPWTTRAAMPGRPTTPDIFGRPVQARAEQQQTANTLPPDHQLFGTQLSSSISSVDDEIIQSTGNRNSLSHDGMAASSHNSGAPPGLSSDVSLDPVSSSVWQPSRSRFESKRLEFGSASSAGTTEDDSNASLRLQLCAKDNEISRLREALMAKDQQIAFLSSQLAAFHDASNGGQRQQQQRPTKNT
eukprot:m.167153 g.167153  ORF g.167153 m.167153 type:complete len:452 (-) comp12786_c0_seq1:244-1599(-)